VRRSAPITVLNKLYLFTKR